MLVEGDEMKVKGEVDARWGRAVDVYVIRCHMHRFIREERDVPGYSVIAG